MATETGRVVKIAAVFRRNLRPKHDTPDLMMHLPVELRLAIYEIALPLCTTVTLGRKPTALWKEPALLRTSRQIRQEAMEVFLARLEIVVKKPLDSQTFPKLTERLRGALDVSGALSVRSFNILVAQSAWKDLNGMLPLLEVMRSTGFDPARTQYQPSGERLPNGRQLVSKSSVFRMPNKRSGTVQAVFESALRLGRRSHADGWTAEKLAMWFPVFVKQHKASRGRKKTLVIDRKVL